MVFLKHVTPSHFVWIHFNRDGDEVLAAGAGPYTLTGENYIETLRIIHPISAILNADFQFKTTTENGMWIHKGMTLIPDMNNPGGSDTLVVDEIWRRYINQPM